MNTSQIFEGQVFERAVQLSSAICAEFVSASPAVSQFFITYLAHLPKANNYHCQFEHGMKSNVLLYCTSGSGWYRIGDRVHLVYPNQYVLIPATNLPVAYGAESEDSWGVYIVHFGGQDLSAFNRSFALDALVTPCDVALNAKGLEIWEEMYQLLSHKVTKSNFTHANFCLFYFLGSFLFHANGEDQNKCADWLNDIIKFMHSRLNEKLSVEDLAEQLNLSTSYFSTLFRKATGLAPLEYFIQLKLQNACRLLKDNRLKVKDVAGAIGYDDPFHFSRLFKKHMRVSPLAYKSACRN